MAIDIDNVNDNIRWSYITQYSSIMVIPPTNLQSANIEQNLTPT